MWLPLTEQKTSAAAGHRKEVVLGRWFHDQAQTPLVVFTARPALISVTDLDPGVHDAILLVLHLKADLVLMDEGAGMESRRLGLTVTGTLGVLESRCRPRAD